MPSFDIETYSVLLRQDTAPGAGNSTRILTLDSVAAFHGIRSHAQLWFWGDPAPDSLGLVANVDQPNFLGHWVFANLHLSDFADIYDVLRSEEPVRLFYEYTPTGFDPQRGQRTLRRISVGTGAEPIGEGPADFSPP